MGLVCKALLNYLMLLPCAAAAFTGNVALCLILPVLQAGLSWFDYRHGDKWQTVLILEIHLLIATVAGFLLGGNLYLKYISDDSDSAIILLLMIMVGVAVVGVMGTVTTLLKYASKKKDGSCH